MEFNTAGSFECVRCGAVCTASSVGDLLIAECPAGDQRYVLTLHAPGDLATEAADDPLIGKTLGPCRLVARAGFEGGLPLYHALDTALNQPRSVRILAGPAAQNAAQFQAFVRAGKLAAAARDSALANVTYLARYQGSPFTVSPALEGQTFDQAVSGAVRMQASEAVRLVRRLARAVAALHARQIVHRNIGPDSVFILPNGEPMLRNFAFAVGPDSPAAPREVVGQPGFLAPEQIAGRALDGRADLYALGALLYLAVVGRPPFAGAGPSQVLRAQLEGPAAARQAIATAAPELADLVTRLLSATPEARPESAEALMDALTPGAPLPASAATLAAPAIGFEESKLTLAPSPPKPERPAVEPKLSLSSPGPEFKLAEPEPPVVPPAAAPKIAKSEPRKRDEGDILALAADEPTEEERLRMLPSLELGPRRAPAPARSPRAPKPAAPAAAPVIAPAPSPALPGPGLDELALQVDHKADEGPVGGVDIRPPEPEPERRLSPRTLVMGGVAALLLVGFILSRFVSCGSGPGADTAGAGGRAGARGGPRKALTEAEKAAAAVANEFARLEAFAKSNAKDPDTVIKQCDLFLEKHGSAEQAAAAKALREAAQATAREMSAEADSRALQASLREAGKKSADKLLEMEAFLKKHAGTKAAAAVEKLRETELRAREKAAEAALRTERAKIEKDLKGGAYGLAIAALTRLAEAYEGTKSGAAAGTEAGELRQKLAEDFKEKKAALEDLAKRMAFAEALAQLDEPLKKWQDEDLRREATALAAALREQRDKTVESYGTFLAKFDALVTAWQLDEALATANAAAAQAVSPAHRELLQAKAGEVAVMQRALERIIAGAKAEAAKAAQGDGKIWLQRTTGARLRAVITDPSATGLEADMPGFKGHLAWADLHADQWTAFARSAPGDPTAADHHALGLAALYAGEPDTAFAEFTKAVELDAGALDAILPSLRHHAQGFRYLAAGRFPLGPRKEPQALDGFLLGRAEVTNAEYAFFARVTKAELPSELKVAEARADLPVGGLTWQEADAYARWLDMRLPTDVEWERAVRGSDGRLYPWGDAFDASRANLLRPAAKGPAAPAPLVPAHRHLSRRDDSPFFHLVGNVREWTATPVLDPKGAATAYLVVGGSAADREAAAAATARAQGKINARDPYTGFRLAWPR
ncbi:MAG TPA: SUMF1/EgtB/PvdO family nonheme iron enzyme [Planctomycetota bacterium]|nr:SUMF1/EgtB/PvdO family nonheme iron enzyme [Planctomycetota bacterium]HRR82287.1 SUMF1/EgtB/PvdO family nonheme iron enzyme [Planctomycetota bacterium]HRT93184.1 SUMF1/EgtB/PvdO family nonheme iron enzyme [Planctomycetota bacterium]